MKKIKPMLAPLSSIKQFVRLLERTRTEHGYKYRLVDCGQLVPMDNPARFESATRWGIRHRKLKWDPRWYYPIDAVWYCFYRKPGEPRHPGGASFSCSMGLSPEQVVKIMASGEGFLKHNKQLRADMLEACGLQEK